MAMEYTEDDLDRRRSNRRLITWKMREGFLHDNMNCEHCLSPMRLEKDKKARIDHYLWRCERLNCRCRISIRDSSFCANSKLSLRKLLKIMMNFVSESSAKSTAARNRVSRLRVGKFFDKMRRAFSEALVTSPLTFNSGFEVEVDELYLKHVRLPDNNFRKQWVMGLFERSSGKCRYFRVEDRSADSLVPPIVAHVPRGDFVYTDEWRAYRRLRDYPFYHFTVNHSAHEYARAVQVGPIEVNVHINNLERLNAWVRAKLRNRSKRTLERLDLVLDEIMYRKSGRSLFAPFKARQ